MHDVITLPLPLTDEMKHLIDGAAIEKMKSGAIVINTARGGLSFCLWNRSNTRLYPGRLAGKAGEKMSRLMPGRGLRLRLDDGKVRSPHQTASCGMLFVWRKKKLAKAGRGSVYCEGGKDVYKGMFKIGLASRIGKNGGGQWKQRKRA
ncbi:MAG: hypothetical protein IJI85_10445 [Clostridia bacterium]|nr:hypothetical protein [Clostridia bacterium]MBQ6866683.1 hypothetical protein [Clostridia bacterium]MBR0422973.1 hypothetical protein [Clostridia bacterium]